MTKWQALASAALLAGASCEADAGKGSVQFTTWGEEYIEEGIPASEFADGWGVTYEKFLIVLGDATVADRSGDVGGALDGTWAFDMTRPGPHEWGTLGGLEARRWDDVGVESVPAGPGTQAGSCTHEDLALMRDGGLVVHVEGTATDGTRTVAFSWDFTQRTLFSSCHSDEHGDGVVVPDGGTEIVQFTIHGDHFFYDDLQGEEPSLRFQAIADADDGDGRVTLEELEAVDLTDLPVDQYGTGGDGSVVNLRQFIEALSHTLVHYRGEGHCHSSL